MDYDYLAKVIVVGDPGIGKSNLSSVITNGTFFSEYVMTIGVDFFALNLKFKKYKWKLHLWDTAGQETFKSITKTYYKESAICLLVFDINNRESFNSLYSWMDEVEKENENIFFVLIGNKDDKINQGLKNNIIDQKSIKDFVKKYNIDYYQTSAKNRYYIKYFNKNMEDIETKFKDISTIFTSIIEKFCDSRDKNNNNGIKVKKQNYKADIIKQDRDCNICDFEQNKINKNCC